MIVRSASSNFRSKRVFGRSMLDHRLPGNLFCEPAHDLGDGGKGVFMVNKPPTMSIKHHVLAVSVLVCYKLIPNAARRALSCVADALPNPFLGGVRFGRASKGVIGPLQLAAEANHQISVGAFDPKRKAGQIPFLRENDYARWYLQLEGSRRQRAG